MTSAGTRPPGGRRRKFRDPVSLIESTHSTCSDSDWSVVQIGNDGAYAEANPMVISTRANRAKGRKSDDVAAPVANGAAYEGLSGAEWKRLICLVVGIHCAD
jgi:hypothetical protein